MKVGDRVRQKYPPFDEGKIIRIGAYPDNPYIVMVQSNKNEVYNFKPEHLDIIDERTGTK